MLPSQETFPHSPALEAIPITTQDREHWEEGADKFHAFFDALSSQEKATLLTGATGNNQFDITEDGDMVARSDEGDVVNRLKAMFLGEKPALWTHAEIATTLQPKLPPDMVVRGDHIFDVPQVQQVMNDNKDIFNKYHIRTAEETMTKMVTEDAETMVAIRGLLFGYPRPAAICYENMQKCLEVIKSLAHTPIFSFDSDLTQQLQSYAREKIKALPDSRKKSILLDALERAGTAKRYETNGVCWVDYSRDPRASQQRAGRIEAAFDISGLGENTE